MNERMDLSLKQALVAAGHDEAQDVDYAASMKITEKDIHHPLHDIERVLQGRCLMCNATLVRQLDGAGMSCRFCKRG